MATIRLVCTAAPAVQALPNQRVCRLRRALALASAAACVLPSGAHAQAGVTHLVVAFPPGGPVDFVARTIAQALGKELGQPVLVENKAGANGAIAGEFVARAAPDGATLWLTSVGAVAINPSLYEKLPYDPVRDLVPVSLVVDNVEVLVVGPNAPYDTGAQFIAAARQPGAQFSLASSGSGSVPHLAIEQLVDAAHVKLLHVPYRGAAPAITDVIGGQVQGFFGDIPGLIGHVRAGRLKAVGIASPRRHPLLPQVPTFDEMGIPGVDSDNWYALFAARGTPAAQAGRIATALRNALASAPVRSQLEASGAQPAASTPAELASLLKRDTAKWGGIVKSHHIKAD